ncbi:MAG: 1-deoxy-D-xylulose-5-phosphate synthase [Candidatus Omnitrophica bacterium CG11_big_fil_rev_8_21_14_0_20_45_26]|uniref:1-deoxy-D-xylulose-5-phosphate synthase n=1 Tax=Candidatus Abzuiibacterium crystallinum TaxID=1974748 RepID=A0A2H0LPZ2_9BACT|nr:MAG: 1-deoxy-D-xylulose-5-phosphate synthase [Candidatus Omnitrophica bacterium CG11_big_fil_rev_8_21_14_0_20_45_26]PIW65622.1 MAG: 1-deoxy-D-xylulose-5-phosphate synthase [Candidatus Omnitrophica bacterium CG12_big_fil_rev_8_21_14_0_65_45_16]
MYSYISKIDSPEDLKKIPLADLPKVAQEYRDFLIQSVSKTGGHLGASLGALELNIALHYVLQSPQDKICWDVGHQAYVHKLITGRRDQFLTLRQERGISGFPSPFENPHDQFIVGHACTGVSQAYGLAVARDLKGGHENIVAVVGDGALTGGLSYEALNNVGHSETRMMIVLNDNEWSISKNVGAISKYLNKVITNPIYNRIRTQVEKGLRKFPRLRQLSNYALDSFKHLFVPGMLFEELGLRYFGPVDGHDVVALVEMIRKIVPLDEPTLLHIVTKKGMGCEFADKDPERLHGVTPFDTKTGQKIKSSVEAKEKPSMTYTQAFTNAILEVAREHQDVVAITAAMPSGTGLSKFASEFPERFFDVGIAEQHAVTFAGALAKGGLKPVCAIYSTFLQRSHDQLIHDVALQRLNVTLCLDRAGLVGADGATHNGVFDISYLGHIPRAVIAAPVNDAEMKRMIELGIVYPHLFALRYPRSSVPESLRKECGDFKIGESELLREGHDVGILALGSMVLPSLEAAERLQQEGISAAVYNMRFAKPLDENVLVQAASKFKLIVTTEEHVLCGGFGSKVLEFYEERGLTNLRIRRIALPNEFIEQGSRDGLFDHYGLSPERITQTILNTLRMSDVKEGFPLHT